MTSALRSSAATEQRVHEASGWRLASAKYSCRRSERNLWARSSIVIRGPRGRVAKRAPLHLDHLMHRHLHEARDFAGMVMQAHRTPAQRFPVALVCRRRLALDCISARAFCGSARRWRKSSSRGFAQIFCAAWCTSICSGIQGHTPKGERSSRG